MLSNFVGSSDKKGYIWVGSTKPNQTTTSWNELAMHVVKMNENGENSCSDTKAITTSTAYVQITDITSQLDILQGAVVGNYPVTEYTTTITLEQTTNCATYTNIQQENNTTTIAVYPNPFQENITLDLGTTALSNVEINVYDIIGRKVKQQNYTSTNSILIHRDNLSSGIYVYQLKSNGQIIATGKIIAE